MIIKKAGCILINTNTKEIGLVYREKHNDFSFPKGHLEQGETLEECAIRETEEETGRKCKLDNTEKLPLIIYENQNGDKVETTFFIGIDKGKSNKKFDNSLVHDLIWVKQNDVEEKLSYSNLIEFWSEIKVVVKEILKKY